MKELNSLEKKSTHGGGNSPVPTMLDIIKGWLHIR